MSIKIEKTNLNLGISKPFKILHITDTHICLSYDSDGEEKQRLKERRMKNAFGYDMEDYLYEAINYAKENDDIIAYTGDIYDYLSQANLDCFKNVLSQMDYIYACGNHDFCTYPGRDKEDDEFKNMQYKLVGPYVKYNLMFDSRVINDVNLVMMDNSYYQFNSTQLSLLKKEVEKGYPILLFFHNPIYTYDLASDRMKKSDCAYVCDPPEDLILRYPKERGEYQRATDITKKMVEYIKSEKSIKCLITGHLHDNYITYLDSGLMQIVTAGTFTGDVREIIVK